MRPFTYNDYIYYIFKLNSINRFSYTFKDIESKYQYYEKELHQPHDKIFKEVLDDKEEAVNFLNKALKIDNEKEKLKATDIEKYNRKFVTDDFKNLESDIIYKKLDEEIFFLIEHQSTIDYSIPYRILKYNIAIMESAIDKSKIYIKEYKMPSIYSFVIYTGKKKWNVEKYIADKQCKLKGIENNLFGKYKVININDYTEEELYNNRDLLSKVLLLEKSKNLEEFENKLLKIFTKDINKQQMQFLKRIINYILKNKIDIEKYNKIINEKMVREGDSMSFFTVIDDYIDEKERNLAKKGEKLEKEEKNLAKKGEKLEREEKKLAKVEEKLARGEEKLARGEEKLAKKEEIFAKKVAKREEEFERREEKINKRISKIVLGMIKSKISDEDILEILEINLNDLIKIKKENHIIV